MEKIRVLVVDDSLTVRKRIVEVLGADPALEVIAEADNGKRAIDLCQALRPDVITLDMMMPVMTGVAVTEYVMAYFPTPILIVSASTNRGELFKTYEALAAGALDVLEKPSSQDVGGEWERKLTSTVKLISRIKVITHPRARLMQPRIDRDESPDNASVARSEYEIVAIGASTGGPGAVLDVLRRLPPDFPLPILLLIHLAEPFAMALAEWLDGQSPLRVRYARDREPIPTAGVVMAPAGKHLVVSQRQLRLTTDPERHSCRPSVDVLFESITREFGSHSINCLLTGMGKDGAAGLLGARKAGAMTIAQNESSSVVFGMPGEAVRIGAATRVLSIENISRELVQLTGTMEVRRRI
ncbi:MAG TPA: chemotaxis-specific protein-glutamate methyltransferase CheB [Candidatus Saccharimonadales bacterium]|nr:chemotaxis-specific protein-glutamate methyltransferase CheB [Candidatus Saccharimonadales bacterium]